MLDAMCFAITYWLTFGGCFVVAWLLSVPPQYTLLALILWMVFPRKNENEKVD
jgi:energy-coupling factor transporter transmembrane protein EcfT